MTLKCRGQSLGDLYTGIRTEHIAKASKMVFQHLSKIPYQNILNVAVADSLSPHMFSL